MAKNTEKRYMSVREMKQMLGISTSLAYNMIYRREIPYTTIGIRRYVIDRDDIDRYLQRNRREAI